jgi:hypothetical protein
MVGELRESLERAWSSRTARVYRGTLELRAARAGSAIMRGRRLEPCRRGSCVLERVECACVGLFALCPFYRLRDLPLLPAPVPC